MTTGIRKGVKPNNISHLRKPNLAQIAVMRAIEGYPQGTRVTPKMLACDLGVHISTIQRHLYRMEEIGLIRQGGWEVVT